MTNEAKQQIIKDAVWEHFNGNDWEFIDFMIETLDGIEDFKDDNEIYYAIDNALIYYSDQWKILMHYQNPQDANFEEAIGDFTDDVFSICAKVAKTLEEEEEE